MFQSVRDIFPKYSAAFEGLTNWPYLDIKGLLTTGIGNLVDFSKPNPSQSEAESVPPSGAFMGLPWLRNSDGGPATDGEKAAEWRNIKDRQSSKLQGGGFYKQFSTLHLDQDGVNQLLFSKLDANESVLRGRFAGWDTFPADAQLGIHSLSWAMGPAFAFPKFLAAANAGDWTTAASEMHVDDSQNAGLSPRQQAQWILFNNAQRVADTGADPSVLAFPPDDLTGKEYPFPKRGDSLANAVSRMGKGLGPVVTPNHNLPAVIPGSAAHILANMSTGKKVFLGLGAVGVLGAIAYAASRSR